MNDRFSTVSTDLKHRLSHWNNALSIMENSFPTKLIGQGLGTFPISYYLEKLLLEQNAPGTFLFQTSNNKTHLILPATHSERISQRIQLKQNSWYQLSVQLKSKSPNAKVNINICHRQIVVAEEWKPNCWKTSFFVKDNADTWKNFQIEFDSKKLGSFKNYSNAPLLLTFSNTYSNSTLEIDNISLKDYFGEELING